MSTMATRLPTKFKGTTEALRTALAGSKPSKYRNQPIVIDGIRFASRAEGKRYQELNLLQFTGEIHSLVLQPRFKLKGKNGGVICTYVGDFQYADRRQHAGDDGHFVVEDVKGVKTDAFRIKAALFLDNFGFPITIIGGKK